MILKAINVPLNILKKVYFLRDFKVKISTELLQKVKEEELKILVEFDKVCKQLGVKYSLSSGTLIGAVRHKGFIPWDDDIDVAMLREDYNKFISKAQQLMPKHLFIQTYETDKEYPFNFAKIVNISAVLIQRCTKALQIKKGVVIDVFPIDRVPSNRIVRLMDNYALALILAIKNSYTFERAKISSSLFVRIIRIMLWPLARLISTQKLNKLETSIRVKNNIGKNKFTYADRFSLSRHRFNDKMLMPVNIFNDYENIMFENWEFQTIKNWHTYLTIMYGNYMELPPIDKRIFPHDIIDLKFD
ncbi:MAG: LicD family protein [Bacteroidetes bacterium ADurb.Bin174]|nr:MAG: LicD family protein [Bacteroidetes bacterium ADurb.Bin174]